MTHNPDTHLPPLSPADLGDRQQRQADSGHRSQCGPRPPRLDPTSTNHRRPIPELSGPPIEWVMIATAAALFAIMLALTAGAHSKY